MEIDIDQAPCYAFVADETGRLLFVNALLCHDLEYDERELAGKKLEFIFTIASRIFYETHLSPMVTMQGSAAEIFMTLAGNGKKDIPVLCNVKKIIHDKKPAILFIAILVAKRNKFEDELIKARKTAEKALLENTALKEAREQLKVSYEELDRQLQVTNQQHYELQQFNRVLSHDLQEPVRKLMLYSNMLVNTEEDGSVFEIPAILEKLNRSVDNLSKIVSSLQQYAWLGDIDMKTERIDILEIIRLAKLLLERDYPGITLQINSSGSCNTLADPNQMQSLFYDLMENAVRFRSGDKIFIEIMLDIVQRNQFQAISNQYKLVYFHRIRVLDEGIGFDPVFKDQLFALFKSHQTDNRYGRGLSMAKKIVDNHKGSITAANNSEKGTIFTILLPFPENALTINQSTVEP